MVEQPYSVDCECGKTLPVSKSDAGSEIRCRCGKSVSVPRLSLLRRAKGEDALEAGIRDRIARMIREGKLPVGDCCAVSGFPTNDVMLFDVICERSYTKGARNWGIALLVLGFFTPFSWFFWLLGYDMLNERTERVGRDVVLTVPLRVAKENQGKLRGRTSQKRLQIVLGSVPEYELLFQEFPDARISAH
ncbi:MAG TPA: hypothetical protein VFV87_13285 [Pirellulaceae bacterium]|nr:hypothetical protein [Pirellulaceae bacterium]